MGLLLPDEMFGQSVIDALDLRCLPNVPRVLNRAGKEERFRLEQEYWMVTAILNWLERWEHNPVNGTLQAGGDPLWQGVSLLHQNLESSRDWLQQRIGEIEEAADLIWRDLLPA